MPVRGPKSGFRRTIAIRRVLRRDGTTAEQRFWSKVVRRQFFDLKFRRQHGIGPYVVDFYCPAKKIVVEIDGDTHATDQAIQDDQSRTQYLTSFGYTVIRYTNCEILNNTQGVFEDLANKIGLL